VDESSLAQRLDFAFYSNSSQIIYPNAPGTPRLGEWIRERHRRQRLLPRALIPFKQYVVHFNAGVAKILPFAKTGQILVKVC
jgi:hypothetical protein